MWDVLDGWRLFLEDVRQGGQLGEEVRLILWLWRRLDGLGGSITGSTAWAHLGRGGYTEAAYSATGFAVLSEPVGRYCAREVA